MCTSVCLSVYGGWGLPDYLKLFKPVHLRKVLPGPSPYRVPTTHTPPGTGWKVGVWYSTEMLCYINLAPQIDELRPYFTYSHKIRYKIQIFHDKFQIFNKKYSSCDIIVLLDGSGFSSRKAFHI